MAKRIGLALGAGGARGIAHVHVLAALDDLGLKPHIIAGSSIGAVIGAGYAAGMSGEEIADYFVKTFSNRSRVFSKLWQLRMATFRDLFGGERANVRGLHTESLLKAFLPEGVPSDFSGLNLPLKVTATEFYGNRMRVIEDGSLLHALAASVAIPVIFKPVIIDGKVLIDGGINNPVPFDLVSGNQMITIAVDVLGLPRGVEGRLPTRLDAGFGASQLMMHSITQHKLREHPPSLYVQPRISGFRVLDFLKAREILKVSAAIRKSVRHDLEQLIERGEIGV
ncbi:MAG: patatin-like phospholipase family protein [Salaquimonas sp.]|nr:patatin-like phospholipase family protein [Salaquimonas sp.]